MNDKEFKTKLKSDCETAASLLNFDCDGVYDCGSTCPYFGDEDDSGYHCIILQTEEMLREIIKISGAKW